MGNSSWSGDAYKTLKNDYATKSQSQIFTSNKLDGEMNPKGLIFRESRDSDINPNSLAICVWLDETGSMGDIPEYLVKNKLGVLIETLKTHGIENPAVLFGGIGDQYSDNSPLQVGQFESGTTELDKWLTKVYLEGNGGGQNRESYQLAWLVAARHTSIDCFEKRQQKGFLFTIGDEGIHELIEGDTLKELMGYPGAENITSKQLLEEAQRSYHVFHLHIGGRHCDNPTATNQWGDLLKERLIIVEDYDTVAEIIASTVAVLHGIDLKTITASFDKAIGDKVTTALMNLNTDVSKTVEPIVHL